MGAVQTLINWPAQDQPRQRLADRGAGALTDSELLAILIRTGRKNKTPVDLARGLLTRCGSLTALYERMLSHLQDSLSELTKGAGLSHAQAVAILAAFKLVRRIDAPTLNGKSLFKSSEDVAKHYIARFRALKREMFLVLLLDARNRLIREVTISSGSLTASIVHPRDVFRSAVIESAVSVIFIHNHPSGEAAPSQDDIKITNQLVEAGNIFDIRVLDHIIVGAGEWVSFAGKGLIKTP